MKTALIIVGILAIIIFIIYMVITEGRKVSFMGGVLCKFLIKKHIPKEQNLYGTKEEVLKVNDELYNKPWSPEKGYILEKQQFDTFTAEILKAEDIQSKKVVLQLHGGGFILGLQNMHRDIAQKYCKIIEGGITVTPNYRTAFEAPFPAGIMDCIETYKWLLEQGYNAKDIIVTGESSGGNFVLSLMLYLKDHGIELPGKAITISPVTDFHFETESCHKYKDICMIGNNFGGGRFDIAKFPYFENDNVNLSDPYLSPYFGDYSDFPPMLMQVGEREVLLDDTIRVAKKIKEAGGKVKVTIYPYMFHVFHALGKLPETKKAWKEINEFLNS